MFWIKKNGTWVESSPWIKEDGQWKPCNPSLKVDGVWKTGSQALELYSPGTESLRSSLFTVEVSSQLDKQQNDLGYRQAYVFGRKRPVLAAYGLQFTGAYNPTTNPFATRLWKRGDTPECSFLTFGVSGSVKTKISKKNATITSVKLRPKSKNWNYQIVDGSLIIDMKPMDKVWVEVNNETSSPLFVFCDPKKPSLPDNYRGMYFPPGVHYLSSIPGPHQTVTYSGVTGTPPATSVYYETFHGINFSSLQNYQEGEDYYIYLDGGSYVVGSFNLKDRNNIKFIGPGILSLENMPKERVAADLNPGLEFNNPFNFEKIKNSGQVVILLNSDYDEIKGSQATGIPGNPYTFDKQTSGCVLSGVTIIDTPYWGPRGFNGVDNVKMISPWVANTDFVRTRADRKTRFHYIKDSFAFIADDALYGPENEKSFSPQYPLAGGSSVFSGLALYSQNNGPINISYGPRFYANQVDKTYPAIIHDIDMGLYTYNRQNVETPIRITLNYNVTSFNGVPLDPKNYGVYDLTLSNIRLEEPIDGALFWIGNLLDPFAYAYQAGFTDPFMFGAMSGITIADISASSSQTNPGFNPPQEGYFGISSMPIWGFDASSRPYNITFKNIKINGEYITNTNRDNFIDWVSGPGRTGSGFTDPDAYSSNIIFVTGT